MPSALTQSLLKGIRNPYIDALPCFAGIIIASNQRGFDKYNWIHFMVFIETIPKNLYLLDPIILTTSPTWGYSADHGGWADEATSMVWKTHKYDEIPGTYVFDGKRAHSAYAMNKLLFSFNEQQNRDEYEANPAAYCNKFKLPDAHKQLFLNNDFLGMLRAGANIYFMAKMAIPRGTSVQDAGAQFQGISTEEFIAKLLVKREGLEDRLSKEGGYWNG